VFQHKPFGIAFIKVVYVAGVPTKILFQRPTTLVHWVTAHRIWTINEYNKVLCTDESRFCVRFSDGRAYVGRAKSERLDVTNVQQEDRYCGGSVMVWGGIHKNGNT